MNGPSSAPSHASSRAPSLMHESVMPESEEVTFLDVVRIYGIGPHLDLMGPNVQAPKESCKNDRKPKDSIRQVRTIANLQALVTFIRCLAAFDTMISVFFNLFRNSFEDATYTDFHDNSYRIIIGSVGAWFLAGVGTWIIDFFFLYNLPETASRDIAVTFEPAISIFYGKFSESMAMDDMMGSLPSIKERNTREYMMRD